jgi:hypothetical protein
MDGTGKVETHLARCVLAAVILFVGVALSLQALRSDLDWKQATLSLYLLDRYGGWLKAAYFVLAAALVLLGIGYYRALRPEARSAAPLLLFAVASVGLMVTAVERSWRAPQAFTLENYVHGVAAMTTFLCVTTGMLLQSWRLRIDPAWRPRFAAAFTLAALSFAGLWLHVLVTDLPRGVSQKVVIALILGWLLMASLWLSRPRPAH